MRFSIYGFIALAIICAAIYFISRKSSSESEVIAMPTATILSPDELSKFPKEALNGNCKAASRLGDFYMTQMAAPHEAEKWYRLADSCAKDSRVKEFLINCIVLNNKSSSGADDVIRLFQEIEIMDPDRAKRMRESVEEYVGHAIPKKS